MKKKKIVILFILALLFITAGGCSLGNSQNDPVRNMGFPSLSAVPDGFSASDAKSIDMGDWCEVTYENHNGGFLSLDCYEPGTFDTVFLGNYANLIEEISLNGKEATVYQDLAGNDKHINIITWEDKSNNALSLLGGNVSIDEMVEAAKSIQYDRKKVVTEAENSEISFSPKDRGTIEETDLKKYADVLESATKPLFDQYIEKNNSISKFELESFYQSFHFPAKDHLLVEVFDYDYVMKANDHVLSAGMHRDEDGNIRDFRGSFGQIAAVSRDGQPIKVVPVIDMDVKLEPEDADEETLAWIKGKVMTAVKSPSYLMRNMSYN